MVSSACDTCSVRSTPADQCGPHVWPLHAWRLTLTFTTCSSPHHPRPSIRRYFPTRRSSKWYGEGPLRTVRVSLSFGVSEWHSLVCYLVIVIGIRESRVSFGLYLRQRNGLSTLFICSVPPLLWHNASLSPCPPNFTGLIFYYPPVFTLR